MNPFVLATGFFVFLIAVLGFMIATTNDLLYVGLLIIPSGFLGIIVLFWHAEKDLEKDYI